MPTEPNPSYSGAPFSILWLQVLGLNCTCPTRAQCDLHQPGIRLVLGPSQKYCSTEANLYPLCSFASVPRRSLSRMELGRTFHSGQGHAQRRTQRLYPPVPLVRFHLATLC